MEILLILNINENHDPNKNSYDLPELHFVCRASDPPHSSHSDISMQEQILKKKCLSFINLKGEDKTHTRHGTQMTPE